MKRTSKSEAIAAQVAQTWGGRDSRVVARRRDVLRFELAAEEEHLAGLRAATSDAERKRAALEAEVAGLTRVLDKR